MKFLEKLKAKLIDQNFKKGAIKAAAIAVLATAVVTFAACNKTGQAPGSGTNNGGGTQQGPDTSYTASQILEENTAYNNLNLTNAVFDEIQQNVAKQFNVEKDKVEIVDMHFDKQNTNRATVVAKIGGEKVVTASYQNQKIAKLRGDKKDLVLDEAGYTADQKVEKDQKATASEKFTQAVQTILDEIKQIENITPERVNEIFAGISNIQLPDSLKNNYDFAVVSGVREDGTVVAFTGKDGKLQDHVLSVAGKENMTEKEILDVIASGEGFSQTTRVVDANEKYETPALEEKPVVETITIGEIFKQEFDSAIEGMEIADINSKLQEIVSSVFIRENPHTILFYAWDGDKLTIYSQHNGTTKSFNATTGTLNESIKNAFNVINSYKEETNLCEKICGYKETTKIEKGSVQEDEIKQKIKNYVDELDAANSTVKNSSYTSFKGSRYLRNSKDVADNDLNLYGAKLCEGKEVIATYVGAMSSRSLDSAGRFNTGYYTTFETTVVYKDGDQVIIKKDKIFVPYYTTSTNESLYNTFLSDTDGTKHNIVSISTEVVNNPVIATENGKKSRIQHFI